MATSVAIGLQHLLLVSHASQLIRAMSVRLAILAIHVLQLAVALKVIHDQRATSIVTSVQLASLRATAHSVLQDLNLTHALRENSKVQTAQSVHSTVTHVRHEHSKTVDLTAAIA
jgi:hypothetical protein